VQIISVVAMPSSVCSQYCSTNQDSPDIFSEILKGVNQNVIARATRYHSTFGHYTISVITVLEIVKGFHKLKREDRVQQFLAGLPAVELLTLDQRSAERAGRI
jgi:tRNA(fMet)-specific endonuclease VapC